MTSRRFDTIVIGAGTWGAAAAWQLAKRGRAVLAIDAFHPPHDRGSHTGETRLFRSSSHGAEDVELTRAALDAWREIDRQTGGGIIDPTGNLLVGTPGSEWFDNTLESLGDGSFRFELVAGPEARERFPDVYVSDEESAIWEPDGGAIRVGAGLEGFQELAKADGAEFRFDEPVTGWRPSKSEVAVETEAGEYVAERVIVAAGAYSSSVLGLDLPVTVQRQVLVKYPVDPAKGPLPSVYIAAAPGVDADPGYGCMEPDGSFKFSVPSRGEGIDPHQLTQKVSDEDVARNVAFVRERLPSLEATPVEAKVCMWTECVDGQWLLGRHPRSDRVTFGVEGPRRGGFRYAPVIGAALVDISEAVPRPDFERFAPERFETEPTDA